MMSSIDAMDDPTLLPTGDKRLDDVNACYFVVREGGKTFVGTFETERGRRSLVLITTGGSLLRSSGR
jgi:hypothetical protein